VHYVPENIPLPDGDEWAVSPQKLVRMIGKDRFTTNPFAEAGNQIFFPYLFLSHGCASWAVNCAVAFADDFFDKIETMRSHEHLKARLSVS